MTLYSADFDVTGGDLIQSFLGLEVEQLDGCIKLHLDMYIQELIAEYQLIRPEFLKPKKVHMSPGLVLDTNDCPETPDPVVQKQYRSIVATVQFAAHWIRFDISMLTCGTIALGSVDAPRWIPRAAAQSQTAIPQGFGWWARWLY